MSKTLIEKIEMQINHAKDCMDTDGTKKGFIQGLEFVKNVLLPKEKQQDQRIAELEKENEELKEQLKGAIVPKFKIGQGVWGISNTGRLFNCDVIQKPLIKYKVDDPIFCGWYYDHELFATEQEARDRLEELKNGKD